MHAGLHPSTCAVHGAGQDFDSAPYGSTNFTVASGDMKCLVGRASSKTTKNHQFALESRC